MVTITDHMPTPPMLLAAPRRPDATRRNANSTLRPPGGRRPRQRYSRAFPAASFRPHPGEAIARGKKSTSQSAEGTALKTLARLRGEGGAASAAPGEGPAAPRAPHRPSLRAGHPLPFGAGWYSSGRLRLRRRQPCHHLVLGVPGSGKRPFATRTRSPCAAILRRQFVGHLGGRCRRDHAYDPDLLPLSDGNGLEVSYELPYEEWRARRACRGGRRAASPTWEHRAQVWHGWRRRNRSRPDEYHPRPRGGEGAGAKRRR